MQHWDRAPSNPARLAEAGIPFAFTTQKLEKPEKDFWTRVRLAVRRGLSKDAALAALTSTPAEMFGVADRLGAIAPGRMANLVIASGDLFADEARVLTTWVDGHYYDTEQARERDLRGTWELAAEGKTLAVGGRRKTGEARGKAGRRKGDGLGERRRRAADCAGEIVREGRRLDPLDGPDHRRNDRRRGEAPGAANVRWSARRTAAYTPVKKPDEKPSPLDKPLDFPETYPAGAFGRIGAAGSNPRAS